MEMARAAGIKSRDDRFEPIFPLRIRELMPTQTIAVVIVNAARVRVPEIEQRAGHRPAPRRAHHALDHDRRTLNAGLAERLPLRRARFEERPGRLLRRRRSVVAGGRRLQSRRESLREMPHERQRESAGEKDAPGKRVRLEVHKFNFAPGLRLCNAPSALRRYRSRNNPSSATRRSAYSTKRRRAARLISRSKEFLWRDVN